MRVAALLSICCSLIFVSGSCAQEPVLRIAQDVRTITTNGVGEVFVVPDKFSLQFSVKTFDKVLTNAYAINDKSVKAIIALAAKYKIAPEKVQTSQIDVDPSYDHSKMSSYSNTPNAKPVGYFVQKSVGFEFNDPKIIASLITDAIEAGANSVSGVTFTSSEMRKHRDNARLMALKAAREKAVMLADEAGTKLGEVIQIVEDAGISPFSNVVAQMSLANVATRSGGGGESDEGSGIAIGQIKILAAVRATYELKSK